MGSKHYWLGVPTSVPEQARFRIVTPGSVRPPSSSIRHLDVCYNQRDTQGHESFAVSLAEKVFGLSVPETMQKNFSAS